jgi:ubiquinone/menaquinone biosynthesis C-methylase UbiE
MEVVLAGRRLQRCRLAWIDSLVGCERILIVGVGHGHFLRRCVRQFPEAHITSVDSSLGMLRRAKARAQLSGARMNHLQFVHATLPAWSPPAGEFDAIVTHFFLDCFPPEELQVVVATLAHAARPAATWLLSDFALPPRGIARGRARAVHALMYAFFRSVTGIHARRLTPPDSFLQAQAFTLSGQKRTEWGLLRSDLWVRNPDR